MDEMMRYIFNELDRQHVTIRKLKNFAFLTTVFGAVGTVYIHKQRKKIEELESQVEELRQKGE